MSSNRALIVDDSRSARHILGRMLESCGLEVHAVESAELALTYLQSARPDVIFMDHLMPGMDGFAAVRVLKSNPDTATIPVLMYTSQEGEMYLSQARALGAIGVLPKTLKHADVVGVLQQLNLNLHTTIATNARPIPAPRAIPAANTEERTPRPEVIVEPGVEEILDYTPPSSLSMPQLVHRIVTEVHAETLRAQAAQPDAGRWSRAANLLVWVAVLVLLGVVIYQQRQIQQLLQGQATPPTSNAVAPQPVAPPVSPLVSEASAPPPPSSSAAAVRVETEAVLYGEVPLSGARLERLRSIVDSLTTESTKGVVRVEMFLGDFCLSGNPSMGYMPAADELLASRCDLVGNPFGDALTVQQRQSVAFANLVASTNSNASAGIKVQLVDGAHKALLAYPTLTTTLTAATWNRIAERNQRVDFTVLAAP